MHETGPKIYVQNIRVKGNKYNPNRKIFKIRDKSAFLAKHIE